MTNLLPDSLWLSYRTREDRRWVEVVCVSQLPKPFRATAASRKRTLIFLSFYKGRFGTHNQRQSTAVVAGRLPGALRGHPITKKPIKSSLLSKAEVSCQSGLKAGGWSSAQRALLSGQVQQLNVLTYRIYTLHQCKLTVYIHRMWRS